MTGLEPLLLAAGASAGAASTIGTIGTVAALGGTVLSGIGAIRAGNEKAAGDRAEALQLDRQAGETNAAAQRNAEQKRKQAALIESRQQAISASSGGGASDPTVLDLMSKTAGEGELQASTVQAEGEEKGKGLSYQAAIKRSAADNAITAGYIGAGTQVLSGINQWARYRKDFYKPTSTSYADAE